MQRRSVLLPEPLGPITTTTSPRPTSRWTPRSTSSRRKRLCTSTHWTMGAVESGIRSVPPACHDTERAREQRFRLIAFTCSHDSFQFGLQEAKPGDDCQVPERGDRIHLHDLEALPCLYLRRVQEFDYADREGHRRVLEHGDELVAGRRDHHSNGLRQDDATHRLQVGHSQALRSVHLAGLDRIDARTCNLRHVGRLVQPEDDDRRPKPRPVVAEEVVFNQLPEAPSSSFTSACSVALTGVATPSSAPRRATPPLSESISVRFPRARSWAVEEMALGMVCARFSPASTRLTPGN